MSQKPFDHVSPRAWVLILLGLATALKALWAMTSLGTSDVVLFVVFGNAILAKGMVWLYEAGTIFNHTPLTGWLVEKLFIASHHDPMVIGAVLRLVCTVADIGLVLGMLHVRKLTGKPPWWALALFAGSPVSIMVSGFHGNIDPIMMMFLFFAAVAVLKDQPVLCGVMFAAACNIKIMPIMVAPVFIFYWIGRGRRAATSFMAVSGTLMLAGAAWGLIHCPAAFLRNVFGYGIYWGTWGVTYWLRKTGIKDFGLMDYKDLSVMQNHVIMVLKAIMIAGVLTLAWRRRKLGGLEFFTTLGAAFTWIFIFMPGLGPQYMVWFAPFLLLLSPGWWTALAVGSSVYMARFYHSTSQYHFPWAASIPQGPEVPFWGPWASLVWFTFIALLCCRGASWFLIEKRVKRVKAVEAEPATAVEAVWNP